MSEKKKQNNAAKNAAWDRAGAPKATATVPIEWALGCISILYGHIFFGWYGSVYATAPAFRVFASVLPEWAIGALLVGLGICRMLAVSRLGHRMRAIVSGVGFFEWFVLFLAVYTYNKQNHIYAPGTALYLLPAGLSAYTFLYLVLIVSQRLADRRDALRREDISADSNTNTAAAVSDKRQS